MSFDKPFNKKRKDNGSHCEAKPKGVQCMEYFSTDWYAGNRCCNKAACKRFFEVAGTYQPQPKRAALGDVTNASVAPPAKPPPTPATAPPQPAELGPGHVEVTAEPPCIERAPFKAIYWLGRRFNDGCWLHEGHEKRCDFCAANARVFSALKDAELARYRASVRTFRPNVVFNEATATVTFEEDDSERLQPSLKRRPSQ